MVFSVGSARFLTAEALHGPAFIDVKRVPGNFLHYVKRVPCSLEADRRDEKSVATKRTTTDSNYVCITCVPLAWYIYTVTSIDQFWMFRILISFSEVIAVAFIVVALSRTRLQQGCLDEQLAYAMLPALYRIQARCRR